MKRLFFLVALAIIGSFCVSATAGAAEPEWHSEQPVAAGIDVPAPIGAVGGMAFWAPNKGVLITSGNGGMPAGIYAYDGSGWYLYSTVCGGHGGGIAISGPDEFWTISDYAEAQEGISGNKGKEEARTLCHFAHGEVVASYAEPASSTTYQQMDAAACSGTTECWFGGNTLEGVGPNLDPFHLHWDGSSITTVPSTKVREPEVASMPGGVEGLAFVGGTLIESASAAPYLREVTLAEPQRFLPIEPLVSGGPFVLSTEPFEQQLWAGSETGTVLHLGAGGFEELPTTAPTFGGEHGRIRAIGAEPGTEAAWLGGGQGNSGAEVRQVEADGSLGPIVDLPSASEGLNPKGPATHIFCPAAEQCWMTTETGWLFHLGGPPAEGVNTDPLMHRLITSRPKDGSSRTFVVSAGLPPDDSGEVEPNKAPPVVHEQFPHPRTKPPLVVKIKQSVIDKTILQMAFTLRGKAHVQLIAKYHKSVVAKTPRLTLDKGRHRLRLHLDPKERWPTSIKFPVHAVGKPKSK